jgi:hypothetical protein
LWMGLTLESGDWWPSLMWASSFLFPGLLTCLGIHTIGSPGSPAVWLQTLRLLIVHVSQILTYCHAAAHTPLCCPQEVFPEPPSPHWSQQGCLCS